MDLKSKIIAALATIGILAGTYTIGTLEEVQCLMAENEIVVSAEVRLCVSDEQLATIKLHDLAALEAGNIGPDGFPRVVAVAESDPVFYADVKGVMADKVSSGNGADVFVQIHEAFLPERADYRTSMKTALGTQIDRDGYVDFDNRVTLAETIDALVEAQGGVSLQGVTSGNLFTKLRQQLSF